MAAESRIFYDNITLMYGEIEASVWAIRDAPFGFGKGGNFGNIPNMSPHAVSIKC